MTVCMKKSRLLFIFLILLNLYGQGQAPSPTILVTPSVICSGQTATFSAKGTTLTPISFSWTVTPSSGVNQISGASDSSYVINFPNAGRYVITLSWAFDVLGSSTKTIAVSVTKSAESSFNASLTAYGYPNEVKLTDYSIGSSKIYWVFDNDFATKDSAAQTTRTYTSAGTFTVLHIAVGSKGCNDTSSYKFSLVDVSKLELPNVFSPNGDGINDFYRPKAEGISKLTVQVYNRFGILVHEWDTVNGFWDGRTTSGVTCDAGTYFVIAEGTGFDGKTHSLRTSLTLMR
jgi:gliding motility-associated-like protein